jgi:DNA-binding transcriptional ArsR family regulator
VPKSTLSQHFKVLREAGLIRTERKGIEMHNSLRHDGVAARFDGLITAIINAPRGAYRARAQGPQDEAAQLRRVTGSAALRPPVAS